MTVIALTIAGSDSGGGAGIQADIKTFSALGVYATSVITAVTAQNTRGVTAIADIAPDIVAAQMDAVLGDMDVAAIKIGMVSRVRTIETIVAHVSSVEAPVIVDPVMVATSGDRLLAEDAMTALRSLLLPLATVVTPNLPEAALLTGLPIAVGHEDMVRQAAALLEFGARSVLIKGGHGQGEDSVDLFMDRHGIRIFSAPRIATRNDHGTGCTLAAAITAHLALGHVLADAVGLSKAYLQSALEAGSGLRVGRGRGPVHHFHRWWAP